MYNQTRTILHSETKNNLIDGKTVVCKEKTLSLTFPTISILVPTYMERGNVESLIESINKNLSGYTFEVIIVDDNSSDGTADEVKKLMKQYANTKLIVRPQKMGLGSAYRQGFKASSYEYIVEMDADMSHDPEEITKLIEGLRAGI